MVSIPPAPPPQNRSGDSSRVNWKAWWLKRLREREPAVLVVVFLLLAVGMAFIQIADAVADGETHHFDNWVLRSLRTANDPAVPIGPKWFAEVARDTTSLGGYGCLIFFTVAVAGYLRLDGKKHLSEVLVVSTVTGYLFSTLLKLIFRRPRPDVVPYLVDHVTSTSFPSGHSMNAAVVYLTLGTLLAASVERKSLKIYVVGIALFLTVAVGLSRIYLGVHYPTDVAAGWMAGIGWALLCWLIARSLQRRGQVESAAKDRAEDAPPRHEDTENAAGSDST